MINDTKTSVDPWVDRISTWLVENAKTIGGRGYTTVSEILLSALKLEKWTRRDEMRVAEILTTRFRWTKGPRRRDSVRDKLVYPYYPSRTP